METIQLQNIILSAELMNANQLSTFTENTYEHKGNSIQLSGGQNIGTLQLSGNMTIGENTLDE